MFKSILTASIALILSSAAYAVTEISNDAVLTPGAKLLVGENASNEFYIAEENNSSQIKEKLNQEASAQPEKQLPTANDSPAAAIKPTSSNKQEPLTVAKSKHEHEHQHQHEQKHHQHKHHEHHKHEHHKHHSTHKKVASNSHRAGEPPVSYNLAEKLNEKAL